MNTFSPRYVTVVYLINDPSQFLAENDRLHAHFYPDPTGKPWAITHMSLDNEIHRLELIEEAVNDYDADPALLDEILSHPRIGCVASMDNLIMGDPMERS
jgi:hypothetical protein